MKLHETSVELEIPFHDCDPLGVVWHGHYYKYMELARTKLLTGLDLDGQELLDTGHRLYVVESKCRYAFPLRYRERARATAFIKETENRILVGYQIWNLTHDKRAAHGHTALATTDAEGNLLLETPPVLLERIHG